MSAANKYRRVLPAIVPLVGVVVLAAGLDSAGAQTAEPLTSPPDLSAFIDDDLLRPGGWLGSDLRVELKAPNMVILSASAAGRLAEVTVRDGDQVQKGQLLIQIDDRLAQLRLEASQAARDQAATQLNLAKKLHSLGSRGALDVEMAAAQFRGAEAEADLARALVDLHQIRAPWDGRVTQMEARADQHVPEGAPLLELAAGGDLELEFMMPSSWLNRVGVGTLVRVWIDETGRSYPAEVLRLGGKVDPVTQSIRVYGRLSQVEPQSSSFSAELLPGMSGVIRLETEAGEARVDGYDKDLSSDEPVQP
jgi:RND family efflux transporter, MFP subunit